jgi:DNA polymerase-3 subunit gamma/tau
MYRVLYRKWRPTTFKDVVGQDAIVTTLQNEIKQNRLNHAYLFVGSRGTGKTTCAKILAKAVNCQNPHDGNPCNECEICKGIEDETILDILEIDAASNNGVNEIRELRQNISYMPSKAKYRVYIIDEVHMLTTQAFNALLKTLEEPPEHIIFILATTELHKLPATITSRCQRFDFRRIATSDIADRLLYIAGEEGIKLEKSAANLIAALADGGLRDALSILEKVANTDDNITEQTVIDSVGLTSNDGIFKLYEAIENGDASSSIVALNSLYQGSRDFRRICEDLTNHYRNLMLLKTTKDAKDLIICPESDFNTLVDYANKTSLQNIIYKINQLSELFLRISRSTSPRYEFEILLVRLTNPTDYDVAVAPAPAPIVKKDTVKAEKKTEVKESAKEEKSDLDLDSAPKAEEKTVAETKEAEEKEEKSETKKADNNEINEWAKVVAYINETDKILFGALINSKAYLIDGVINVKTDNNLFESYMEKPVYKEKMKNAIIKALGKEYRIKKLDEKINGDKKDPLDDIAKALSNLGDDFMMN